MFPDRAASSIAHMRVARAVQPTSDKSPSGRQTVSETQTIRHLRMVPRRRPHAAEPSPHVWAVVPAGGDRDRRPPRHYIVGGTGRPGDLGLPGRRHVRLDRTLERAARMISPERMLAVMVRQDADGYGRALAHRPGVRALVQPAYRGSAAEIFLAVLKVAHEDPHATVVVLPPDQLVDHEARFMHAVWRAVRAVELRPDVPVVIGAHPRQPDPRYAWIEPGPPVEGLEALSIRTVQRFLDRPSPTEIAALFEGNGLLSTLVVIAKARTLLEMGRAHVPEVLETLEPVAGAFGGPEEALLTAAVYECMPHVSLAGDLLQRCDRLAVLAIPDVMWRECDRPALAAAS
jgi:mannose-1-phosphate guanylyltransferase